MSDLIDLAEKALKTNNAVVGGLFVVGVVIYLMFKKAIYPKTEVELMLKNMELKTENELLKQKLAEKE